MPERLELVSKPRATIVLFETQKPLLPNGVLIELFSTARRVIFEKHTEPSGVVRWYKVSFTPGTTPAEEVKP